MKDRGIDGTMKELRNFFMKGRGRARLKRLLENIMVRKVQRGADGIIGRIMVRKVDNEREREEINEHQLG